MNTLDTARIEKQGMRVHRAQAKAICTLCKVIEELADKPHANHEAILNVSRALANVNGKPQNA